MSSPPRRYSDDGDAMELQVIEDSGDDMQIDEELVVDSDLEFEHDTRINRGRKSKRKLKINGVKGLISMAKGRFQGKYSQVAISHETRPDDQSSNPTNQSETDTRQSNNQDDDSSFDAKFGDFEPRHQTRLQICSVIVLLLAFVSVILAAGLIGWIIGSRASKNDNIFTSRTPKLIVVSIDGFRATYLTDERTRNATSAFQSLISTGVSAKRMIPTFPSQTFPSHYTLLTGLHSESHGVVANHFYDPESKSTFVRGNAESVQSHWWLGEPIWTTAKKFGLSSGVLNWPGSFINDTARQPTIAAAYNGSISDIGRVHKLLEWLDSDACTLCMIYFSSVDVAGHAEGPDSEMVLQSIKEINAVIGALDAILRQRVMTRRDFQYNMLLVSDHGMASVDSENQIIMLDEYLNHDEYILTEIGANGHVRLTSQDPNVINAIMTKLRSIDHVKAVKRQDMSSSLHYSNNIRIADIIVMAELGWQISDASHNITQKGAHGYDPALPEMGALFILNGVGVRDEARGQVVDAVNSVDMYSLMCYLMGVSPAPNNGTSQLIAPYLKHGSQ